MNFNCMKKPKAKQILLLCFSTTLSCQAVRKPVNSDSASLEIDKKKCGDVLTTFEGIKVHFNGTNTGTGTSCAGKNGKYGYLYQCKELVMRYFQVRYGTPQVLCDAKNCLEAFAEHKQWFQTFTPDDETKKPQKGDAIVFTGHDWGHVALVTEVENGRVHFVQQNMRNESGSVAFDDQGIYESYAGFTVHGFIRAKVPPIAESTDNDEPSSEVSAEPVGDPITVARNSDEKIAVVKCGNGRSLPSWPTLAEGLKNILRQRDLACLIEKMDSMCKGQGESDQPCGGGCLGWIVKEDRCK